MHTAAAHLATRFQVTAVCKCNHRWDLFLSHLFAFNLTSLSLLHTHKYTISLHFQKQGMQHEWSLFLSWPGQLTIAKVGINLLSNVFTRSLSLTPNLVWPRFYPDLKSHSGLVDLSITWIVKPVTTDSITHLLF